MKNYKKGFTLIELLVVIAIIGILSSVVLVSLNTARNKGKDTRIIATVSQLRTQFESSYTGSAYPDLATNGISLAASTSQAVNQLYADAASQGGVISIVASTPFQAYAIYGKLVSDATKYFCIDSTGKTNPVATVASGAVCP